MKASAPLLTTTITNSPNAKLSSKGLVLLLTFEFLFLGSRLLLLNDLKVGTSAPIHLLAHPERIGSLQEQKASWKQCNLHACAVYTWNCDLTYASCIGFFSTVQSMPCMVSAFSRVGYQSQAASFSSAQSIKTVPGQTLQHLHMLFL